MDVIAAEEGTNQALVIGDRRYTSALTPKRQPGTRLTKLTVGAPVVSQSAASTLTAGSWTSYPAVNAGVVYDPAVSYFDFGLRDGQMDTLHNIAPGAYANSYPYNAAVLPSSAKGAPLSPYYNSTYFLARFMTDAPVFEIIGMPGLSQSDVQIYVDGQPVSDFPTIASNPASATGFIKLDFAGVRKSRLVEVEGGMYFIGVKVDVASSVWRPAPLTGPTVAVLGDSYTQGTGAATALRGYAYQLGRILGWDRMSFHAQGGTGYVNDNGGAGGVTAFGARVAAVVADKPDVVVVFGGLNDAGVSPTTVAAAARAVFVALRAGLPRAKLVYVGPVGPADAGGVYPTAFTNQFAAVAASGTGVGDVADLVVNTVSGYWISGSGYAGHTTGDGNGDFYLFTDKLHPSQSGHSYLAKRLAAVLARAFAITAETLPLPDLSGVYQPRGTQAQLTAFLATLAPGTEYVWSLTNGAGTLLDIVSGVA